MPPARHPDRGFAVDRAVEVGCRAAAREFGVSKEAVRQWCRDAGVAPRRLGAGRPPGPRRDVGQHRDGTLDCECWCRTEVVRVTPADVRAGRTGSCGSDRCKEAA